MQLIHILRKRNLSRDLVQPYELYLADEILKDPDTYRMAVRGTSSYKILDNSLNELGYSVSLEKLDRAAEIVWPNEIVIPDEIDPVKSREAAERAFEEIHNYEHLKSLKKMVVVHANTPREYLDEMLRLDRDSRVDTIGIPKVVASRFAENSNDYSGRVSLYAAALCKGLEKPVHFLGWAGFREFETHKWLTRRIRSMDSRLMLESTDLWSREDLLSHIDLQSGSIESIEQSISRVREVYESYGLC